MTQKDIALHFKHEVYNNGDYSKFLQNQDTEGDAESDGEKKAEEEPQEIQDPEAYSRTKEELK